MTATTLGENGDNLISDLEVLEELLASFSAGPMVTLLRNEFTGVRTLINNRRYNDLNRSNILQRSAYLGTGRGGSTQTPTYAQDPAVVSVGGLPPPPPPFMNATQRAITASMAATPHRLRRQSAVQNMQ